MATSSILGGSHLPDEASGKDLHALGPSDNSDSGSDAMGAYGAAELASDSDAAGTGERAEVGFGRSHHDADILPDHIERTSGGLDDADLDDAPDDTLDDLSGVEDLVDDSESSSGEGDEGDEEPDASGRV